MSLSILTGCGANFHSIYRSEAVNGGQQIISQDAKQRTLVMSSRYDKNGRLHNIVCTEPSPDALTVLATAASGNIDVYSKVAAAFSSSTNETGTSIGLRTQSIQLLRDAGYRICEAYASGAITEADYSTLLRRYQTVLIGVLAIEQLTGTVKASSSMIGGTSHILNGEALVKLQELIEHQDDKIKMTTAEVSKNKELRDQAKNEKIEADKSKDEAKIKAAAEKLKKAEADLKTSEKNLIEQQKDLEALKASRTAARNPSINLSSLMENNDNSMNGADKSLGSISKAVETIVTLTLAKSYIMDFCQAYFQGQFTDDSLAVSGICNNVVARFLANNSGFELGNLRPGDPESQNPLMDVLLRNDARYQTIPK
jgi:hypothetical protein